MRATAPLSLVVALLAQGCAHTIPERAWVHSLQLRGVRNVSKAKLEKGLASRPTPHWQRGPERAYDELELERDRMRVQRYYESQGYYATKVVMAEGHPAEKGGIDVIIAVEEGAPTYIGDVRVFGINALDRKTRKKIQSYQIGLQRGQVFHHAVYETFKADLTHILKERGFDATSVEGSVDVSPKTNLANITLTFHPHGVPAPKPAEGTP